MAAALESFDDAVDLAFGHLRGRPIADSLASASSFLGDRGLIWFLLGMAHARRGGNRRVRALKTLVYTGTVAPAITSTLKEAIGRVRPELRRSPHLLVRVPRTASFPSGHAVAAWCAATMFGDRDRNAPVYYAAAIAISLSRIHVQLHHATDVVAGSLLGIALGRIGVRFLAELTQDEANLEGMAQDPMVLIVCWR